MASVQVHMFFKVKKHQVFVSSWIKGMRSNILIIELGHIKVAKNINTAMFLKYIYLKNLIFSSNLNDPGTSYVCHCELALEEQFLEQPFHTSFMIIYWLFQLI